MNKLKRQGVALAVIMLFCALLIRLGWLVHHGQIQFKSDLLALLPTVEEAELSGISKAKLTGQAQGKLVILIQGKMSHEVDAATDSVLNQLDYEIQNKGLAVNVLDELNSDNLTARIKALLPFKPRLISDITLERLNASSEAQLQHRKALIFGFPPSNISDPVGDPLGTLEEFVLNGIPKTADISFDGLYLKANTEFPTNVLFLELTNSTLAGEQANQVVAWLHQTQQQIEQTFAVNLVLSGIPLHAAATKAATIDEIKWMSLFAGLFSFAVFYWATRSMRALFIAMASIGLAITGALTITYETLGLPHLVGLTMATTAIGICIDISFHYWVTVRSGKSGQQAIRAIAPGLNMSVLTSSMGLLIITIVSIPVLARTAALILAALLLTWLLISTVVPILNQRPKRGRQINQFKFHLSSGITRWLTLIIVTISTLGLIMTYSTDDRLTRIGRQVEALTKADKYVRDQLQISEERLFTIETSGSDELLEIEAKILASLTSVQKRQVSTITNLVPSENKQLSNQTEYFRHKRSLDDQQLADYATQLGVDQLEWGTNPSEPYTLDWALKQHWATGERNRILLCEPTRCASVLKAPLPIAAILVPICNQLAQCKPLSFAKSQENAFKVLRHELAWSLLLAVLAMFVTLYLRYKRKALVLIATPILACVSGLAAVAISGNPITVFSLVALFPLLGLSIDYVVFSIESTENTEPAMLAIFASALTTAVSFGLLAFSGTPAVQFFALPVAIGIPVAWISMHLFKPHYE